MEALSRHVTTRGLTGVPLPDSGHRARRSTEACAQVGGCPPHSSHTTSPAHSVAVGKAPKSREAVRRSVRESGPFELSEESLLDHPCADLRNWTRCRRPGHSACPQSPGRAELMLRLSQSEACAETLEQAELMLIASASALQTANASRAEAERLRHIDQEQLAACQTDLYTERVGRAHALATVRVLNAEIRTTRAELETFGQAAAAELMAAHATLRATSAKLEASLSLTGEELHREREQIAAEREIFAYRQEECVASMAEARSRAARVEDRLEQAQVQCEAGLCEKAQLAKHAVRIIEVKARVVQRLEVQLARQAEIDSGLKFDSGCMDVRASKPLGFPKSSTSKAEARMTAEALAWRARCFELEESSCGTQKAMAELVARCECAEARAEAQAQDVSRDMSVVEEKMADIELRCQELEDCAKRRLNECQAADRSRHDSSIRARRLSTRLQVSEAQAADEAAEVARWRLAVEALEQKVLELSAELRDQRPALPHVPKCEAVRSSSIDVATELMLGREDPAEECFGDRRMADSEMRRCVESKREIHTGDMPESVKPVLTSGPCAVVESQSQPPCLAEGHPPSAEFHDLSARQLDSSSNYVAASSRPSSSSPGAAQASLASGARTEPSDSKPKAMAKTKVKAKAKATTVKGGSSQAAKPKPKIKIATKASGSSQQPSLLAQP
eukprot:CAMPEP_0170214074 /NCGR_PEP_ID=MMETSP0116_2-20130129/6663_1 /TAXON_ID=400756 /ORGANISM="Durinskia baltica, Strain CSIRO CS-38" /LENGTH=678 /DNA_ID=CAMNT_0010464629 /DNA_START=75 /DNA_END=2111 /DNA_ORIENTATION=+